MSILINLWNYETHYRQNLFVLVEEGIEAYLSKAGCEASNPRDIFTL